MDTVSTKKMTAVVVILAVLCAYTWSLRLRTVPRPEPPGLDSIPRSVAGFTARDEYISPESLRLLGADMTLARSYVDDSGAEIDLFIGYFAAQQENSQIHSPKHCYPGAGWDIISEGSIRLDIGGSVTAARKLLISDGSSTQLVVYWFYMRDGTVPDEFSLKWRQMTDALLARPQAASFIRFSAIVPPGEEEAIMARTVGFIEDISPHVLEALSPRGDDDGS
jgi:EpsI family protein